MRILLTGGGTLGSVTPLLAIAEKFKTKTISADFLWIGTKTGPEKDLVLSYDLKFKSISAGKLRRYFSLKNLSDIIKTILGILQALLIIHSFKPHLIVAAGSFVQVPLIWAAHLINLTKTKNKKIKILIHQQDLKKGLANRLSSQFADKITVSTKKSLSDFPKGKTSQTGNPYRQEILTGQISEAIKLFKLNSKKSTILVLGGGTGAESLNKLISKSLPKLLKFCQVIHITGKNKKITANKKLIGYYQVEFLNTPLKHAYLIADLVITRAGFATLTELTALAKPSIIIPIPESHQEANAEFWQQKEAAVVLNQNNLTPEKIAKTIKELLNNREKLFQLSINMSKVMPKDSTDRFIREIKKLMDQQIQVKQW